MGDGEERREEARGRTAIFGTIPFCRVTTLRQVEATAERWRRGRQQDAPPYRFNRVKFV